MATETVNLAQQEPTRLCRVSCDDIDDLTRKLAQLGALLHMTYGVAQTTFENMNETLKENFLWACSDLADDCEAIAKMMALPEPRREAAHV